MEKCDNRRFAACLVEPEGKRIDCFIAPKVYTLPNNSQSKKNENSGAFTFEYFARVRLILTKEEKVRESLLSSGKNLTRQPLNRQEYRVKFWDTVVAPVFNDEEKHFFLSNAYNV